MNSKLLLLLAAFLLVDSTIVGPSQFKFCPASSQVGSSRPQNLTVGGSYGYEPISLPGSSKIYLISQGYSTWLNYGSTGRVFTISCLHVTAADNTPTAPQFSVHINSGSLAKDITNYINDKMPAGGISVFGDSSIDNWHLNFTNTKANDMTLIFDYVVHISNSHD
mmetsp:Transcript_632/g.840  ORF Transcript_632/g.840 Transcript_632/m.840 type:complete len:165 (+) Transcript_632:41-535(+)